VPTRPEPPETVGAAEIAQMLGVSRQRVSQLTAQPGFPEPWLSLRMGKIWLASDVRQWATQQGRAAKG
jgi:predicted DNA-binding transcriptional regulator AlpA